MDENYGQYSQRRPPQMNSFYGNRRLPTRSPFQAQDDCHHRGRGGGFNMQMMPQSGFTSPPPISPSYNPGEHQRGNGRGIRKQSMTRHTITGNSFGPRGGTDITGRSAPIIEQDYSVGHAYSHVVQAVPLAHQQPSAVLTQVPTMAMMPHQGHALSWSQGHNMYPPYNIYEPSQRYLPPMQPYVAPQQGYTGPQHSVQLYYNPSIGYFSYPPSNSNTEHREPSSLNVDAPSYVCSSGNVSCETMSANSEEKWTDHNPEAYTVASGWNVRPASANLTIPPEHASLFNYNQPCILEQNNNERYYENLTLEIPQDIDNNFDSQIKENILGNNNFVSTSTDKLRIFSQNKLEAHPSIKSESTNIPLTTKLELPNAPPYEAPQAPLIKLETPNRPIKLEAPNIPPVTSKAPIIPPVTSKAPNIPPVTAEAPNIPPLIIPEAPRAASKKCNISNRTPIKPETPNVTPPIKIENMAPKKDNKTMGSPVRETNQVEEKRIAFRHGGRNPRNKWRCKENIPCKKKQESPRKDDYEEQRSPPTTMLDFEQLNRQAEEYRRAELAKLTPIVKDVYVEDPRVAQMNEKEIKAFREFKHNIQVSYVNVEELSILSPTSRDPDQGARIPIPNPVSTFEQGFRNYPEIMEQIMKQGFSLPTPIQCQLWPCVMKGLDVVGIAQTGSGKTLAFLLPALIHIERQHMPRSQRNSPTVLILAPTRELAQQIDKEVKKYSYKNIRSVCLYGGGSRADQIEAVSLQTEIIIATPGRLNDLVQADKLNLKEVSMLILDEADEMLDQGFEPQINKALLKVRGDRQTILTSATWPASVRRMAYNYTKNPVLVVVGTTELRAVTTVKQNIVFIEEDDKFNWLIDFCKNMSPMDKAIIFVGKKALADHISSELTLKHISCQCIHGALSQCDREQAIADMQSGAVRIMVATDVAARGIDIDNVTHIINHDFPRCVEQYVHRIGRTGRAGRLGESHTFISRRDWSSAEQLVEILRHAQQEVPQELIDMGERFKNRRDNGGGRGGRGGRGRNSWEDRQGGGGYGNYNQGGGGGYGNYNQGGGRGFGGGDRRGGRGNFRY